MNPVTAPSTPAPSAPWGQIFPQFIWGAVVSQAGDAVLYRATFGSPQTPCVLLPLGPERFPQADSLAQFAAGMEFVKQVEHPALLKILGVGVSQGCACVCYQYFPGKALADWLTPQPKARWSVQVMVQIAGGMQAAHRVGVLHRDVNPAWILVDAKGDARLLGVGVGPLLYPSKEHYNQALFRRPASFRTYVAPEFMKPEVPLSYRVDLFSLGSVAYHLLTGETLGVSVLLPSTQKQVGTFLDDVVFMATLDDPAQRQESAEKFAADISRIDAVSDNSHLLIEARKKKFKGRLQTKVKPRTGALLLFMLAGIIASLMAIQQRQRVRLEEERQAQVPPPPQDAWEDEFAAARKLLTAAAQEQAVAMITHMMLKISALDWTEESMDRVERFAPLAIATGTEDDLMARLHALERELPPDSPDLTRVALLVNQLEGGKEQHRIALANAKIHLVANEPQQARVELARAQAFLEDNPQTLAAYAQLPGDYLSTLRAVLDEAKLPDGQPVQYAVWQHALEIHLDLANNKALTDLAFLTGHAITHLDLSNTGVRDLTPIGNLPLHVLHLDDTPVTDLRPLVSQSLRCLTAEGNEIREKGSILRSVFLTNYRLGLPFQKTWIKTDRARAGHLWVNPLGMHLAPLVDRPSILFSDWETRVEDFQAFASESQIHAGRGLICRDDAGQWKSAPFSWAEPPGDQGPTDPVVGVTFAEATRFCEWLTRKAMAQHQIPRTAHFRLPNTEEWMQAASPQPGDAALARPTYPWGNEWPPNDLVGNYPPLPDNATAPRRYPFTSPVGRYRNLSRHRDLGGNVREWCLNSERQPVLKDASCQADTRDFPDPQAARKLTAETKLPPEARDSSVGFRVLLEFSAADSL